jgi:excisionase family DNA binding protein
MDSWEKMYSVKEVSAILGVSCDSLRRMLRRREMKAWRLPHPSNKRIRTYAVYRIPEGEIHRVKKAYFGIVD